jgi:hypothetical protein
MPTHSGPNILGEENLVFAYDTGDVKNSYIGEPATNSQNADISSMTQVGFDSWSCYDGSPPYHTWGTNQSKTFVTIPGPFGTSVNAMLYHNFNGGFYGPTDWGAVPNGTITSGRTYTVQGWVKAADSESVGKSVNVHTYYNHSGGAYSAGTNYTLTDQWQLVSHTHTAQYNASGDGVMYFFTQNSGEVKMHLTMTGVFLDKSHAVPWIIGGSTRSNTQGLLDLTNNSTINLSTVSFDGSAQMTFDGTDDTVSVPSYSAIELVDNVSIEYVYMRLSTDPILDIIANKYHNTGWELFCQTGNTFALAGRNGDGTYYSTANPAYTIQNNKYYHLVAIKEALSWRLYVNGELYAYLTANSIGTWSNTGILQIGGEGAGYFPNMKLPVLKIYNRVLTASEISRNFNAIKSRFNI